MNTYSRSFLDSLPKDEESPDRAIQFRELVAHSCVDESAAATVRDLYFGAASGDWGRSLHDKLMLLHAISLNPHLERELRGAVNTIVRCTALGTKHRATKSVTTDGIVSDGKRLHHVRTAQPGFPSWVHVETLSTSFCGGDYEGRMSIPSDWPHMVTHHEAVVRAKENGGESNRPIKAGHLYVPMPGRRPCIAAQDRDCRFGEEGCAMYVNRGTSRWHGYATTENLEDPNYLVPLPDDLAEFGFLVEPSAIANHALRHVDPNSPRSTDPVAIIGLGPIGLLIAAELSDLDIPVVGFDRCDTGPRREVFELLGPKATFVSASTDAIIANSNRYELVIEVAGGSQSFADAVDVTKMGGTVLGLGIPMSKSTCAYQSVVVKNVDVQGIASANRVDFNRAIKSLSLWKHSRPSFLDRIVTHRIPYKQFERALDIDPQDRIKVALAFCG